MNSLSVNEQFKCEGKIPKIFCRFEGQFDLEGQGQCHKFLNPSEIFRRSMKNLSVKAKFQMGQKFKTNIFQV